MRPSRVIQVGSVVCWVCIAKIDEEWNCLRMGSKCGERDTWLGPANFYVMTVTEIIQSECEYHVRLFVPDHGFLWAKLDDEYYSTNNPNFFLKKIV